MKKMSKGMLMTALICGAVYMGATPVYANDVQEFTLDEYVVTAARTETKLVDTPANISVVDAKTIEERHYQDVSEVLKDVPGSNVLDSGSGAYEKAISLNGDTRVLILVDGRRMDFASGTSTGRASFDMGLLPDVTLIERVDSEGYKWIEKEYGVSINKEQSQKVSIGTCSVKESVSNG